MFIVIEGIDGAGKTTQAKMLTEYLSRTKEAIITKEPSNMEVGRFVREQSSGTESLDIRTIQLLCVADRSEHAVKMIEPALRSGKHVICDRYITSTIVYGCVGGLDEKWLVELNSKFPKPDATLIIDISAETAMERITSMNKKEQGIETYFEKSEFLKSARKQYKRIADSSEKVYIVDGERTEEEILKDLISIIDKI